MSDRLHDGRTDVVNGLGYRAGVRQRGVYTVWVSFKRKQYGQ